VAQALRCCSPTLKRFGLRATGEVEMSTWAEAHAGQVEQLREDWVDVLAAVSACRELQMLVLPPIGMEPLFPPGTTFGSLTHVEVTDHVGGWGPDPSFGWMGLWEPMASGGLPALAKLRVRLEGRWGGPDKVRLRVAPAFEAVAGTLTYLNLEKSAKDDGLPVHEVGVGYQLEAGMTKLRRLTDYALDIRDSRATPCPGAWVPAAWTALSPCCGG
jgi:hypothetical protein